MLRRLRKRLHGEQLKSDCPFCERRTYVRFADERRCVKGHVRFYGTTPRLTRLHIGKRIGRLAHAKQTLINRLKRT